MITAIIILAAVVTLAAMAGTAKYVFLRQGHERAAERVTDEQVEEARKHLTADNHEVTDKITEQ